MNNFNKLSDDVFATSQVFPEQIDFIKEQGFKSILINRPDMEKPGQPHSDDIKKLAEQAGLEVRYVPMRPGQLSLDLIDNTKKALEELPKPILAYCASGTRSSMLWCFAKAKDLGVDTVLQKATSAGFDVMKIRPALAQYVASQA